MDGESILAQCPPFYATNRRLLRCEAKGAQEEFYDLPYPSIESVELLRRPQPRVAIGGIALAFSGVMLWTMGLVSALPVIVVGVGVIIWGARGREGYYQFRGYQMTEQEVVRWQVRFQGSARFIAAVGEHVRRPMKWT